MGISVSVSTANNFTEATLINRSSNNTISTNISTSDDFSETNSIFLTDKLVYGMFGNFGNVVLI